MGRTAKMLGLIVITLLVQSACAVTVREQPPIGHEYLYGIEASTIGETKLLHDVSGQHVVGAYTYLGNVQNPANPMNPYKAILLARPRPALRALLEQRFGHRHLVDGNRHLIDSGTFIYPYEALNQDHGNVPSANTGIEPQLYRAANHPYFTPAGELEFKFRRPVNGRPFFNPA